MAKRTYAAMLEPTDTGFGVSFPDLPGCVSFGDSMDEAVANAHEALALHLEGMVEDGERLPVPSHMGDLLVATGTPLNIVWAAISVEDPEKGERVNVYLPKSLLERMETFGERHGVDNRSTFLRLAARYYLATHSGPEVADVHQG